jgi:sugar phosphate isomerase/epimerase
MDQKYYSHQNNIERLFHNANHMHCEIVFPLSLKALTCFGRMEDIMRVATMTNLFRDQRGSDTLTGYIESMRRCKAAGFDVLDLNMCAMSTGKTEFNNDDWMHQADKVREEAEKLGIVFSQSHPPYRPTKFPHFKKQEEEDYFNEITRRSIIISGMMGVKWAVMHPVTAFENGEYILEEVLPATVRCLIR